MNAASHSDVPSALLSEPVEALGLSPDLESELIAGLSDVSGDPVEDEGDHAEAVSPPPRPMPSANGMSASPGPEDVPDQRSPETTSSESEFERTLLQRLDDGPESESFPSEAGAVQSTSDGASTGTFALHGPSLPIGLERGARGLLPSFPHPDPPPEPDRVFEPEFENALIAGLEDAPEAPEFPEPPESGEFPDATHFTNGSSKDESGTASRFERDDHEAAPGREAPAALPARSSPPAPGLASEPEFKAAWERLYNSYDRISAMLS